MTRKRLTKRRPFRYLETNIVFYDLSGLGVNRPPVPPKSPPCRPPRPREVDTPRLATATQDGTITDDSLPYYDHITHSSSRLSSSGPEKCTGKRRPYEEAVRPNIQTDPHRLPGADTIKKKPPYDRASSLAQSYQTLLPNLLDLEFKHAGAAYPPRTSHYDRHQGQRSRGSSVSEAYTHIIDDDFEAGRLESFPSSIATSSVTAVETDCNSRQPYQSSLPRTSQAITRLPACTLSQSKEELRSSYVGLQICLELLTDELAKAFFRQHPDEKNGRVSKLQVLLLIEAYEAMLEACRQQMLKPGIEDEERKHTRNAIRVLDHWLHSLYCIYEGAFTC